MRSSQTPRRRTLPAVLTTVLLAAAALLVPALPAAAHDELIGTDPASDAVLETLPEQITLSYSADVLTDAGATVIEVTDAAGTSLTDGVPEVSGSEVTQALAGPASGTVTVQWRVVSSDGHPVSGEYAFVAGDPAAAPDPAESSEPAAAPDDESASPALWIGIGAGAVVLVGALAVVVVAASRRRTED